MTDPDSETGREVPPDAPHVLPHGQLHDISVVLRPGTPEWPGDTPFDCRWTARIAEGESVNLTSISGSPHVGTHADAPLHVRDGWAASHTLPLEAFAGPCIVVNVSNLHGEMSLPMLDLSDREPIPRLLLYTGRSIAGGSFPPDWPVLTTACVDALLRRGLRLLGVDAPSVDARESKALAVHHRVFAGGAYLLENLDLTAVTPGRYELIALPLRLHGLDAAPVRAALRTLSSGASPGAE
ncbi:MAG: cyclase family protein [Gemmatimonadaceae bacterium]|nr:cyclase family protein [Gemmatimonadaceae bacterium]